MKPPYKWQGKKEMTFKDLPKDKMQALASMGGKVAHASGNAHEFTSEEAKEAGKLGGLKISQNKEHMARIGRLGAESRKRNKERAQHVADIETPEATA